MRAYEQIRVNLSLLSHTREINVNLIGVGCGLSYDVADPTHHCIEDISMYESSAKSCRCIHHLTGY